MRGAAVSGCRIAECGTSSASRPGTAIKSANETEGHLLTSRDLNLVSLDEWQTFSAETIEIRKMVYAYRKKVFETPDPE